MVDLQYFLIIVYSFIHSSSHASVKLANKRNIFPLLPEVDLASFRRSLILHKEGETQASVSTPVPGERQNKLVPLLLWSTNAALWWVWSVATDRLSSKRRVSVPSSTRAFGEGWNRPAADALNIQQNHIFLLGHGINKNTTSVYILSLCSINSDAN